MVLILTNIYQKTNVCPVRVNIVTLLHWLPFQQPIEFKQNPPETFSIHTKTSGLMWSVKDLVWLYGWKQLGCLRGLLKDPTDNKEFAINSLHVHFTVSKYTDQANPTNTNCEKISFGAAPPDNYSRSSGPFCNSVSNVFHGFGTKQGRAGNWRLHLKHTCGSGATGYKPATQPSGVVLWKRRKWLSAKPKR